MYSPRNAGRDKENLVHEGKLMDIQGVFVIFFFLAAIGYIGRLFYQNFFGRGKECNSGCGACSTVDFESIEKKIAKNAAFQASKDA